MEPQKLQNILIVCLIFGYALMEWVSRRYKDTVTANGNDTKLELLMFLSLLAIAQPIALLVTGKLCAWLIPDMRGAWANWPVWAMLGLLLVGDDLTQYLWHRASHTPLLWPLHRAHHSAEYMSIRVTYRNKWVRTDAMLEETRAGASPCEACSSQPSSSSDSSVCVQTWSCP